jgi:prepilin-type N-terminal cleavage/methylation domain-containing protein
MKTKSGHKGFTLVEVVVVVAIIGVLAAVSIPAVLTWLPNMRLNSAARDIYGVMSRAKLEAIKRGVNVTVLFSGDSYIMFLDNGAGGGVLNDETPNGTEPILASLTRLPQGVTYDPAVGGDGVTFGNNDVLVFNSRGIPFNTFSPNSFYSGRVGLRIVDGNGNTVKQRSVDVSSAGRISIQ